MHAAAMEIILFHINRVKRRAESTSYLMVPPLNIITTHTHTLVFHQLCNLLSISPAHSLTAWRDTHTSVCCFPVMYYSCNIISLSKPDLSIQVKREEKINSTSFPHLSAGYYWLLQTSNEITSVCAVDQLDHISGRS